jgi:hypothetical protein
MLIQFPVARVRNKKNAYTSEAKKLELAIKGLNYILAHPRYKEEVEKRTYNSTKDTGLQVYAKQCAGDQGAIGDDLGEVEFDIALYHSRFSRVVGYTYLESLVIYVNRRFFSTPKWIASNLWHEGNHQIGYTHYEYPLAKSVSYQMNEIIEMLWDELNVEAYLAA